MWFYPCQTGRGDSEARTDRHENGDCYQNTAAEENHQVADANNHCNKSALGVLFRIRRARIPYFARCRNPRRQWMHDLNQPDISVVDG
jgi:hypothetical protein